MKQVLRGVSVFLMVFASHAWCADAKDVKKSSGWGVDFKQAQKEAATLKQPILAFFTGSDWCGWCVKLKKEVLDTSVFEKFAAENFILFEADFPRGVTLPEELQKQNNALAETYGVRGFPTIYLLDAEGRKLGQTGYRAGGDKAYVSHLKELMKSAGLDPIEKSKADVPLSTYDKMKAEKAAQAVKNP